MQRMRTRIDYFDRILCHCGKCNVYQRHLNYPAVPKPKRRDPNEDLVPKLVRTLERIEVRLKLLEDEQREKGIDLSQFYDSDKNPRFD